MKKNIPIVVYRLSTPSCASRIPTLYYKVLLKNHKQYTLIYIKTMHGNHNNYKSPVLWGLVEKGQKIDPT